MTNQQNNTQPLALLADDDSTFRFLVCKALEKAGFKVMEAGDGQEAISLFEKTKPDIILLDIKMPELDGFETCIQLRKLPGGKYVPIIVITGLDDTESINKAYEVGATDFITKPINWLILGHRVNFMLRANKSVIDFFKSEIQNQVQNDSIPLPFIEDTEEPAIDKQMIENIRALEKEVDSNILSQVIETYLADSTQLIQTIETSISQNDISSILMNAVHLRSKSKYMGALKLASLCRELGSTSSDNFLETARELIKKIESENERVKSALLDEREKLL